MTKTKFKFTSTLNTLVKLVIKKKNSSNMQRWGFNSKLKHLHSQWLT